jgi:hypothetical protein
VTFAICASCGDRKFGALTRCAGCGRVPATVEDQILSIAYSDHYHDAVGLDSIAQAIKRGERPTIPAQLEEVLRREIGRLAHLLPKAATSSGPPSERPALPFNPSMPDITSVQPSRQYQAGANFALFLKRPRTLGESGGMIASITYPYVLAVVARSSRLPLFMVTLETGFFGTKCLCTFGTEGRHSNLGPDVALENDDAFLSRAAGIIESEFGVSLKEVPPPPTGYKPANGDPGDNKQSSSGGEEALADFLKEMDANVPPELRNDPDIVRMHALMQAIGKFVTSGTGTDVEGDRLVQDLRWATTKFPRDDCEELVKVVRASTPRYRSRIADLMRNHLDFVMSGKGNAQRLLKEIAALKAVGVLSAKDSATLEQGLSMSTAEERLARLAAGKSSSSVYGTKSWWQRLFG